MSFLIIKLFVSNLNYIQHILIVQQFVFCQVSLKNPEELRREMELQLEAWQRQTLGSQEEVTPFITPVTWQLTWASSLYLTYWNGNKYIFFKSLIHFFFVCFFPSYSMTLRRVWQQRCGISTRPWRLLYPSSSVSSSGLSWSPHRLPNSGRSFTFTSNLKRSIST